MASVGKDLDKNGNPLVMSGVVSYAVVDPTRAALDVLNVPAFVKTNAHAALKRVASLFPYETPPVRRFEFDDSRDEDPLDSNARVSTRVPQTPGSASSVKPRGRDSADDAARSVSLKTESHLLGDHLREMLQARMEVCGIKIVSFELSDLAEGGRQLTVTMTKTRGFAAPSCRAPPWRQWCFCPKKDTYPFMAGVV